MMVLDTICEDFENIDQIILPMVAQDCGKLGLAVKRSEVVCALALLVEDGMARAYDLHDLTEGDPFSGELRSLPPLDQVENDFKIYFYITEQGKELHRSYHTSWPFDDDGERRPNWQPALPGRSMFK